MRVALSRLQKQQVEGQVEVFSGAGCAAVWCQKEWQEREAWVQHPLCPGKKGERVEFKRRREGAKTDTSCSEELLTVEEALWFLVCLKQQLLCGVLPECLVSQGLV